MRYFYDTEFIDNGETIEFISIGIVAEDGREYYAITDNEDTIIRARAHPWLRNNVMPYLPVKDNENWYGWHFDKTHKDYPNVKPVEKIRQEILSFFRHSDSVEYWAYYSAYDHVVLSQIFGKMIDLPLGLPMYTNDLMTVIQEMDFPGYPEQLGGAHNALEDARWNKSTYEYLQALRTAKESVLTANPKRTRIW